MRQGFGRGGGGGEENWRDGVDIYGRRGGGTMTRGM